MPPTQAESPKAILEQAVNMQHGNSKNAQKETVIVFDWDDTLLASSYLSSRGYRLDTDRDAFVEHHPALAELEACVINVLQQAMTYGTVHVITNAETGWVQLSAAKFLPSVVPWLDKVNVISARSTYEAMFPDSPLKWKFYAFQERLSHVLCDSNHHCEKNIISFGDSHVEREAVRAVTRGVPNTKTKSVKFAERPSMEQLRRQLELVTNCMQYIFSHEGDLDLQLTVTVNNNNSNAATHATSSPIPATASSPSKKAFPPSSVLEEKSVV